MLCLWCDQYLSIHKELSRRHLLHQFFTPILYFWSTVFVCGYPCLYSRQTTVDKLDSSTKIDTRRPRWYAYIIQIIQVWPTAWGRRSCQEKVHHKITVGGPYSAVPCHYPPKSTRKIVCRRVSSQSSAVKVSLPHMSDVVGLWMKDWCICVDIILFDEDYIACNNMMRAAVIVFWS